MNYYRVDLVLRADTLARLDAVALSRDESLNGFVVAAVLHAGDNYRDQSDTFSQRNFSNRPRQVSRVIDDPRIKGVALTGSVEIGVSR